MAARPRDQCAQCHATTATKGVPKDIREQDPGFYAGGNDRQRMWCARCVTQGQQSQFLAGCRTVHLSFICNPQNLARYAAGGSRDPARPRAAPPRAASAGPTRPRPRLGLDASPERVASRAANSRGSRGSHRTPWCPVEDPLHPLQIEKAP
jgi:hypothetical protein